MAVIVLKSLAKIRKNGLSYCSINVPPQFARLYSGNDSFMMTLFKRKTVRSGVGHPP